jgi:hypothetical protein
VAAMAGYWIGFLAIPEVQARARGMGPIIITLRAITILAVDIMEGSTAEDIMAAGSMVGDLGEGIIKRQKAE